MIRRPPRSTLSSSSAASDVYKRQYQRRVRGFLAPNMASQLRGQDNTRDKQRDAVRSFSLDATQYAKQAELGDLMTEMLTATLLSKPDKPIDFLIDLLAVPRAKKVAVCAPPGVPLEAVIKAIADEDGSIAVSLPPLVDEAKDRIIDGKTVEEHGADGATIPDHITAKLVAERLSKPDCVQKGWVLENMPTSKGQAQRLVAAGFLPERLVVLAAPDDMIVKHTADEEERKGLPARIALYHRELVEVKELFGAATELFECDGPGEAHRAIPAIKRALKKKSTDPGLSKKPGLC
eukprot:TRINITY_DN5044_c0_g1_i5.p1 TRINITY_DN5044_c0_g1~~TRINITY_DN5044_c0_g1_i5.p1  ORF type:complete len:292 (-),score=107.47 TRINITY_DN5044_c0_g1_i5:269-1144(-)